MSGKTFGAYVAVLDWYDGDTFYGVLDQGRGMFHAGGMDITAGLVVLTPIRHRCALIQAPEMKDTGGVESRDFARTLVPPGVYPCVTYKADDTYDRPLVDLILPDGRRFSEASLTAGRSVAYR